MGVKRYICLLRNTSSYSVLKFICWNSLRLWLDEINPKRSIKID